MADLGAIDASGADIAVLLTAPERRADILQHLSGIDVAVAASPLGLGMADAEALLAFCKTNGIAALADGAWRADPLVGRLADGGVAAAVGEVTGVTGVFGTGLWHTGVLWIDLIDRLIGPIDMVQAVEDTRDIDNGPIPGDQAAAFALGVSPRNGIGQVAATAHAGATPHLDLHGTAGRLSLVLGETGLAIADTAGAAGGGAATLDAFYANLAEVLDGTADPVCTMAEMIEVEQIVEAILDSADRSGERLYFN
ncbi:MAG: hypothetical protein VW405_11060 [Rhodospirillaceae bacterium]